VIAFTIVRDRVARIDMIADPDLLRRLDLNLPDDV